MLQVVYVIEFKCHKRSFRYYERMLSFVIPAWNEQELIGHTIKSIHKATLPLDYPYEIVVADDASDDQTVVIAESLGARVVPCNNRQIAATRNVGARASTGKYLVFVDADTFVPPEVVSETLEAFRGGAVSGGSFPIVEGKKPIIAHIIIPLIRVSFRLFGLAAGAYLFCTREAFEAVGGFDENFFASEEVVLSRSLHKHGRFCTIRSRVITSGRKFRTYSTLEHLVTFTKMIIPFNRGLQKRHDLWYGERRSDRE